MGCQIRPIQADLFWHLLFSSRTVAKRMANQSVIPVSMKAAVIILTSAASRNFMTPDCHTLQFHPLEYRPHVSEECPITGLASLRGVNCTSFWSGERGCGALRQSL